MIKVLIDTNIILDIALNRKPFFEYSSKIFEALDNQLIDGFVSATTITDIYYIARKQKNKDEALAFIKNLIEILEIVGVDKEIIIKALESDMPDLEDAIQAYSAKANLIDVIVTRNVNDFTNINLKIMEPEELIQFINS